MLQTVRKAGNSIVVKIFFVLLVVSFALIGVGSGFRDLLVMGTGSNDAATVGGTKIGIDELDQNFRKQLSNYQQQSPDFSPTAAIKQQIVRQTLDQKIADTLVAEAAANAGLRVSDEVVRGEIEKLPNFAGDDQKFDRARFVMTLQNQGMTEGGFTALIREEVARRLLVEPIASGAIAPKALVDAIYRYQAEQRVAETVLVPSSAVAGIPSPTDADLTTYHQKHAADFTLPEYRGFTVLVLTPDLFMGEIKPTDEELRAAYDAHKSELVEIEKRKIEQVVVPEKATADAIVKDTQGGKSLADAAKANKAESVALDFTAKDQFPEALRDPVFTAAKGALIGPVQSPLGWHIIRIDDIHPGHEVSFDDAKPNLLAELKKDGAADRLSEQIDKLGDKLTGGTPMDQVGSGVGATPVKFAPVDARGEPQTKSPDAKAPDPAWVDAAFKHPAGETSPFQEAKDGGYFAVRVDTIVPPLLRPLAEVHDEAVKGWIAEQKATLTAKRADELAQKARAGTPMADIAKEAKTPLETSAPVTRDPTAAPPPGGAAVPPALIGPLFQLAKAGDIATAATPDGVVIARLSEIKAADPDKAGAALDPLKQQVNRGLQEDELTEYQAALRQQYKVKINPAAVEQVAGQ